MTWNRARKDESRIGNRSGARQITIGSSPYEGNVEEGAILNLNNIATSANDNAAAIPGIQSSQGHQKFQPAVPKESAG
jgi:hypothetical protein